VDITRELRNKARTDLPTSLSVDLHSTDARDYPADPAVVDPACVRAPDPAFFLHSLRFPDASATGSYTSPSPLPDGRVLVSWSNGDGDHDVYVVDPAGGAKTKLLGAPGKAEIEAVAAARRSPAPSAPRAARRRSRSGPRSGGTASRCRACRRPARSPGTAPRAPRRPARRAPPPSPLLARSRTQRAAATRERPDGACARAEQCVYPARIRPRGSKARIRCAIGRSQRPPDVPDALRTIAIRAPSIQWFTRGPLRKERWIAAESPPRVRASRGVVR
jgi:hypothetical protein